MHILKAKSFVGAVLLLVFYPVLNPLWAATAGATLSGTVTGPSGTGVASATVIVTNEATGKVSQAQADFAGHYTFPNLPPGDYQVSVSAKGYETKMGKVTLAPGGNEQFDAALAATPAGGGLSLSGLGFPTTELQPNPAYQALLNRRSHMLQVHQRLGLIAAVPMIASLITSPHAKGHHGLPGSASGRDIHAVLGASTAALYFSSAYFAIRAPKIPGTHVHGPIRLHKALAWIHGPGMILTPILGAIAYSQLSNGERIHGIAKYHSDVAWVTAAAYGAAIISVSVKF
jgi:Carboxypeptidase regulatory-like domain